MWIHNDVVYYVEIVIDQATIAMEGCRGSEDLGCPIEIVIRLLSEVILKWSKVLYLGWLRSGVLLKN